MIPQNYLSTEEVLSSEKMPSQTFLIDFDEGQMGGFADGLDALRQTVFCILNIERYEHLIYSWDYGVEFEDLFGLEADEVLPEIEHRITDALLQDDRIVEVGDFSFEMGRGTVSCTFRVETVFGELFWQQEVGV